MTDPIDENNFDASSDAPPEPPPIPEPQASESAPPPISDPADMVQSIKEKATDAFKTGTQDARDAFDKNFPSAKDDIAKGVNDASYAIGYAVSFGTTLLKEFTPNNMTDGFERGSDAGSQAAERVIDHRKAQDVDDVPDPAPS